MTRTANSPHLPATSNTDVTVSVDGHVCPFCGLTREITDEFDPATPCPRCTLADTPATRSATKARIGPWHVRQVRNPWAPGMAFETLLALVKRGQVTKDSIVRGPTTHQLWKRACEIKGLSREFGMCFSCQAQIDRSASLCPHCNRLQEPPINPDVLVEGREPVIASVPSAASVPLSPKAQAARVTPPKVEPRDESREEPHHDSRDDAGDEPQPPRFEIGSSTPNISPDEMLAADEAALARQITSRPPVATPMPTPPPRPPRSLRPRTAGVDDALLTPQELAQAFQLGFSATNTAAPKTGGGVPKFAIVVTLLLLIGGAAALASLQPGIRKAASRWISDTMTRLTSPDAPPVAPAMPRIDSIVVDEPPAATQPQREPVVIAPPPAPEPKTVEVADAPLAPQVVESPASAPAEPVIEIPAPASPPITVAAQIPAPPPAVDVQISPPDPAAVTATQPATPEPAADPEDEARTLWRKAIDAEWNQDYVGAVECYEKIRKLPAAVHPGGLELRLEQAKKLAK